MKKIFWLLMFNPLSYSFHFQVKIIMRVIGPCFTQMFCFLSLVVLYCLPVPEFQLEKLNLEIIFANVCTNGGVEQLWATEQGTATDAGSTRVRRSRAALLWSWGEQSAQAGHALGRMGKPNSVLSRLTRNKVSGQNML